MANVNARGYWSATPILPKKFEDRFMQRALREFMHDTAQDISQDLLSYTVKWKHKPKVETKVTAFYFPLRLELVVEVLDPPYTYMDEGTKRHMVRPKHKLALHWGTGKGKNGKGFFSKGHMVKGIHARRWTTYVKKRWDKKLAVEFQKLLAVYAVKTGYSSTGR